MQTKRVPSRRPSRQASMEGARDDVPLERSALARFFVPRGSLDAAHVTPSVVHGAWIDQHKVGRSRINWRSKRG